MYFKNIQNNELQEFHKTIKNNFKEKLTNILDSELFLVETIINEKIYRVFPLFYCDIITSNNENDQILGNRCIICEYNTNTVLNFIIEDEDVSPIDIIMNNIHDNGMDFLQGVVYNKKTGEGINNALVEYTISKNNTVLLQETVVTSRTGFFTVNSKDLQHTSLKDITITATFKNQTKTVERQIL